MKQPSDINMNIYEVIGAESDPIYGKIEQLEIEEQIKVAQFYIRRTDKFYEILSDDVHEWYKTVLECYQCLTRLLEEGWN